MKKILLFTFFIFSTAVLLAQSRSGDSYRSVDEVQVFPNPATSYIGLSAVNQTVEKVIIFNLVGREMRRFNAESGEKFYIGDLPNGMYLVQLLDEQNRIIKTQRVNKR